ncbi:MAG: heme exporter protein [Gaiellaceae bacterium]|nr:heme exporter protein [Gaiellaceae bacterium]
MAPAVELAACSKRFGERIALRRVSFGVPAGTSTALMGANGSGKSTALRIVAGLVRPTAGTALVGGIAAVELDRASRGTIGYLGHRALAYRGLTAAENLTLFARLYRRPPEGVGAALAEVGLADRADDRIDGFSRGMLQRLSLARILVTQPGLLLLDEPATGLDNEGAALLDDVLARLRGSVTVLAATHDEEFAARHADAVVRLAHGEVVA